MSAFALDAATLKAVGALAGLVGVAAVPGLFSLITSHRTAGAQIRAAEVTAESTARAAAEAKASEIADKRAQRVVDETSDLITGFRSLLDAQGNQIARLTAEVLANHEAIVTQRHDMDAIAQQKDALVLKVEAQIDRIADLETSDRLKTNLIDRIQRRLTLSLEYVQTLSQQLIDHGHEPEPPPPGLRDR